MLPHPAQQEAGGEIGGGVKGGVRVGKPEPIVPLNFLPGGGVGVSGGVQVVGPGAGVRQRRVGKERRIRFVVLSGGVGCDEHH